MGILCIALKETKYKMGFAELAFVKVIFDRMVMIFYRICNFFFICCAIGLLHYSKGVWSKVCTPTVYLVISCWVFYAQICIRSGKVVKCMPYLQCFQVSRYIFYISKLNNVIYMLGVPNLHLVVLFISTIVDLK